MVILKVAIIGEIKSKTKGSLFLQSLKAGLEVMGYKPNYPKSAPTARGQKWQNKIRAERGLKIFEEHRIW